MTSALASPSSAVASESRGSDRAHLTKQPPPLCRSVSSIGAMKKRGSSIPRQTCEWCGRKTTTFRPVKDSDGYECRYETDCIARRYDQRGKAPHLSVEARLALLKEHDWNFKRAADSVGICPSPFRAHLEKHAPKALAEARRKGLIRQSGRWKRSYVLNDPEALRRVLRMYDGNRTAARKALEVSITTLVRAMRRLIPGEFPAKNTVVKQAPRPKRGKAVHPWRQWERRAAS